MANRNKSGIGDHAAFKPRNFLVPMIITIIVSQVGLLTMKLMAPSSSPWPLTPFGTCITVTAITAMLVTGLGGLINWGLTSRGLIKGIDPGVLVCAGTPFSLAAAMYVN